MYEFMEVCYVQEDMAACDIDIGVCSLLYDVLSLHRILHRVSAVPVWWIQKYYSIVKASSIFM